MALSSVKEMVKDRLPFTNNVSFDAVIERVRIQMCYIMQNQTQKSDLEVEAEANYRGVENIMFSLMVAYQLVKSKAVQTMGGDGSSTSSGGAKILKKAKADVTEAEFIISKAEDGSLIQIPAEKFLMDLLNEMCTFARSLNYIIPWCNMPLDVIPAFIVGADFPCEPRTIDQVLDGDPVGGI